MSRVDPLFFSACDRLRVCRKSNWLRRPGLRTSPRSTSKRSHVLNEASDKTRGRTIRQIAHALGVDLRC